LDPSRRVGEGRGVDLSPVGGALGTGLYIIGMSGGKAMCFQLVLLKPCC